MTTTLDGSFGGVTRVGWLSSWNSKCGIAEYSKFLLSEFQANRHEWTVLGSLNDERLAADHGRVLRCWTNRLGQFDPVQQALSKALFDILVVQFNFSFLSLDHLERLIACCRAIGTRTVIMFHSTADVVLDGEPVSLGRIAKSLSAADLILAHSSEDVERLRGFGVDGNVELFPHGYMEVPPEDEQAARSALGLPAGVPIIGSYGFLLPHKGIDVLVEAFALLRAKGRPAKLLLVNALYPSPVSDQALARCRQIAAERGIADDVIFETRFLPNEDSMRLLAACDVVVYPYQTTQESSSAAVRVGIAARRPVLCTPLAIFSDVAQVVRFLDGTGAEDVLAGIESCLADEAGREMLAMRQAAWLHRFSWPRVAQLLQGIVGEMAEYKYSAFQAEIKRLQLVVEAQQAQIEGIYKSQSWRLTRPLRAASRLIRFGAISVARRVVHRFPALRRLKRLKTVPAAAEASLLYGLPISPDGETLRRALPSAVGETLDLIDLALEQGPRRPASR